MIKLSELILKNFLSHIDTTINMGDYEGLILVEGQSANGHYSSNGSGKSTLLEGIVYALTGDTLRGVSVNDVVNRNIKKNTCSSLKFMRDGTEYSVSRYRKDDINGDSLFLYKEGENISKRVNKETQKSLDDILGISYKILVSTILLGEGLSSKFTQLSDPEKKSLIESTLNLTYDVNKIREKANNSLKALNLELSRLDGEISTLTSMSEIDRESIEKSIEDNYKVVEIYQETAQYLKDKYDNIVTVLDSIHPKLLILQEALQRYRNLHEEYETTAGLYYQYVSERETMQSAPSPVCKLCHQHIASTEAMNSVLDNYDKSIKETYSKLESINAELERLPSEDILVEKIRALNAEYTDLSTKAQDIMKDYNESQVKIAEASKDISSAENRLSTLENFEQTLSNKSIDREDKIQQIDEYSYFYNLFSPTGIIINILTDAVDYINDRLSTYSEVLLEKDYKITFLKGKISLVDSKGSNYQSLSNGEKRRLDIAIQFSLHDYVCRYCGNNVDTMFIDEILDTLDDVGIENIITVLRLKLDYCGLSRIFVISHNSELKAYFDNVITVSKDMDGNSKLI